MTMEGRVKNCFYTKYAALNAGIDRANTFIMDKRMRKNTIDKDETKPEKSREFMLPRTVSLIQGPTQMDQHNNQANGQKWASTVTSRIGVNKKNVISHSYKQDSRQASRGQEIVSSATSSNLPFLGIKSMSRGRNAPVNPQSNTKARSAPQSRDVTRLPYTVHDYDMSMMGLRHTRVKSSIVDGRGGPTPANSMVTTLVSDPLERLKRKLNLPSATQRRLKNPPPSSRRRPRTQQYDPPEGPVFASQMLGLTHVCFPVPAEKCVNRMIVFDPRRVDRNTITRKDVHYISFSVPKRVSLKSDTIIDSRNPTHMELLKREFEDDPIVEVNGFDVAGTKEPMGDFYQPEPTNQMNTRAQSADVPDEGFGEEI